MSLGQRRVASIFRGGHITMPAFRKLIFRDSAVYINKLAVSENCSIFFGDLFILLQPPLIRSPVSRNHFCSNDILLHHPVLWALKVI